ncbi:MAG: hypothetical protein HFF50_08135 [Lawsonibacter sp.]|nr:hypothetical protein [Lawsonibacter sp.]
MKKLSSIPNFSQGALCPGGGTIWREGLLPPLDRQQDRPMRLCPLCGQEQYRYDPVQLWRGRRVCAACLDRLQAMQEEEMPL